MIRLSGLKIFVSIVVAAVVAVVVVGLYLAGSPARERNRRFDEQRLNALQQVSSAVQYYFDRHVNLPQTLEELREKPDYFLPVLQDPKTGEPYEYGVLSATSYQLCANFDLSAVDSENNSPYLKPVRSPYSVSPSADFWQHEAGYKCFTFEVHTPTLENCAAWESLCQPKFSR